MLRKKLRHPPWCAWLAVLVSLSGCIVHEGEARERALWSVTDSMTKAEIVRLAGEPDETAKPEHCKTGHGAKEEILYFFEDRIRLVDRRFPRVTLYFCLTDERKVVDCCGWIYY